MKHLTMILLLFCTLGVMGQTNTVRIDGQVAEATRNGDKFEVFISVSPKKATTLITKSIKAKKTTTFFVGEDSYTITYTSSNKYHFNDVVYNNVEEVRKGVRTFIRDKLNIH